MLIGSPVSRRSDDHSSPSTTIPVYSVLLDCQVTGALATIHCTQRFQNDGDDPLECALRLPVDEDAAIVDLHITLDDGRVLKAGVEDKETAREVYSDAISSGHTAAVGEVKGEKEFEISIGNLKAHGGVQADLSFVVPLRCKEKKWLFTVPQWVVPEWTNAPISANRFRCMSVADQQQQFAFGLTISQTSPILTVESSTHPIALTIEKSRLEAVVSIDGKKHCQADTIEVEFATAADLVPKLQTQFDPETGEYAGMLSLIPPLLAPEQTVTDLEGKGDFVILLDRSGSMVGQSIAMAKEAAIFFIKSLSEGNTFNVVSFGSEFEKLFPKSREVTGENVALAVATVDRFEADLGGTNILPPLQAVLTEVVDPALPRSLYLLTDGEVENRQAVIACLEQYSKQVRAHAFGIGTRVDRSLIRGAAKASHGVYEFITDLESMKKKVVSVLKKAILPALSNLAVTWPSDSYEQFPSNRLLPVCYFGELLVVFVHYGAQQPPPQAVILRCVNTSDSSEMTWEVPITTVSVPGTSVHKLWAKHAIKELTASHKKTNCKATLARLKDISKKYGIPSEHTSFVCVAESDEVVSGQLKATAISLTALHPYQAVRYPQFVPHPQSFGLKRHSYVGCKGVGKVGAKKRHRRCVRENIQGITKPAIKRIVRRSGATRVSGLLFDEVRVMLREFLQATEGSAVAHTEYAMRKTVSALDMVLGLRHNHRPIYGVDGDTLPQAKSRKRRVQDSESEVPVKVKASRSRLRQKTDPSIVAQSEPVPATQPSRMSLLDLISLQDISGKWLYASGPELQQLCPLPDEFQKYGKEAKDLWVTLCVVVLLECKYAAEAEEWELVVRKAKKRLRAAGVEMGEFAEMIRSSIGN